MSMFDFNSSDIDWNDIAEISEETYQEPSHKMLECPKCHHIDRDIHFKKVDGVEDEN